MKVVIQLPVVLAARFIIAHYVRAILRVIIHKDVKFKTVRR